jgi:glycosyltransferase involved in cell wall biosynthesis
MRTSTQRPRMDGESGKTPSGRTGVLHVITGTARRGAETFAVDLADALAERGRTGRVVALTASGWGSVLDVPTLGRRRLSTRTLRALRSEVKQAGVVVAHGSSAVVACALATIGTRTPFVYRNIGDPLFWLDTPRRRRQMTWILRRAAATVALWEDSGAELRSLGGDNMRVHVIPTGVPARLFTPIDSIARRDARRRLEIDPGGLIAVYIGSLSAEKNVDVAIAAVSLIPDARLLIVGDGPERDALESLARTVAPGRIRFLGWRERPRDELAAADVLVLSSRTEGLPAVLIEAAFSGLPVVASRVGGISEIVVDGRTGFTVPPGDPAAMSAALRDVATNGPTMGKAGRRWCLERFEIGRVAQSWDALLDDLGAWSETP